MSTVSASPEYKGFPYGKILILGATSGLGWALAEKFVAEGKKVIISGRRKHRLDEFINTHGGPNAGGNEQRIWVEVFDLEKLDGIGEFVKTITSSHPDLDCAILNSGIQRGFDFTKPDTVDLGQITSEFNINYLSYLYFTKYILSHFIALSAKQIPTSLIYMSSGLAFIPIARCPNYCATKAAIHHFALSLRNHMNFGDGTGVKVVEIIPPAVQTELHDELHQPDIKNGRDIGIPIQQFTKEAWEGLVGGKDEIPIGVAQGWYNMVEPQRKQAMGFLPQAPAGNGVH